MTLLFERAVEDSFAGANIEQVERRIRNEFDRAPNDEFVAKMKITGKSPDIQDIALCDNLERLAGYTKGDSVDFVWVADGNGARKAGRVSPGWHIDRAKYWSCLETAVRQVFEARKCDVNRRPRCNPVCETFG